MCFPCGLKMVPLSKSLHPQPSDEYFVFRAAFAKQCSEKLYAMETVVSVPWVKHSQ